MSDLAVALVTVGAALAVITIWLKLVNWGRERTPEEAESDRSPLASLAYFLLEILLILAGLGLYRFLRQG